MSCYSEEEMDELSDSDSEYEIVKLNPNIMYESDDSPDEDMTEIDPVKNNNPSFENNEHICYQEVEMNTEITLDKIEEVSCDSFLAPIDDENSMNSNESVNSPKKVKKKLNFQEYKMRRANELSQKPLFDLPKKIAAYELCDAPASLPLLVLPTDPNWMHHKLINIKSEPTNNSKATLSYNPEHYEEIVLVSIGCNTEITIPPIEDNESNESISANKFLTNIVNNLNKDNVETLLKSSTTLFSSIQAVVQGKCVATETDTELICDTVKDSSEHGEDKTIMHLRKDRLRPFKCSLALQTDNISLFPPLLLSPSLIFNRIRNARSYRRKISRSSRSRSRSFSPSESEYSRVKYHNSSNRYSRSQHSTHSSSLNSGSSSSESDSDSSGYSRDSSSDSLKRFNDRQNFRFYNRNQPNQGYKQYQEERKIVYIGGLEEETTKDEIRRKFLSYGTIKKISFHAKEDGLRYGFVTFAEASCAYEVIDKFAKDPLISKYDIRFGGRRKFCKQTYADLDSIQDTENQKSTKDLSFEELLKMAKKKIVSKK